MKKYSKLIASAVGTLMVGLVVFGIVPADGSEQMATMIAALIGNAVVWFAPKNTD